MSALTAEGRRRIHDHKHETAMRGFNKDPRLVGLPVHQRVTLSELKLIGRDLYRYIKQRGVILPDGTVNPAVEAHRKNAHEQLFSLQVFLELNRSSASESRDLVADMARAIEAPAAGQDESASVAATACVEPSAPASDEQATFDFAASADNEEAKR